MSRPRVSRPSTRAAGGRARRLISLALIAPLVGCPDSNRGATPPVVGSKPGCVILISLDTVRQDHLSVYGYPRPTTPRMEELAASSAVFTNAMAQAPYTLPSHMTMITGMHPRAHGVRFQSDALSESVTTMAELAAGVGYRAGGFADCVYLDAKFGFGQGFDTYVCDRRPGGSLANGFRRWGGDVHDWIKDNRSEPFFLFIHSYDPHGPYDSEPRYTEALAGTEPVIPDAADDFGDPMEWARQLRYHDYLGLDQYQSLGDVITAYDATLRFVDEQVGRLVDLLKEEGRFDDALIMITSDHGESFLDHQVYIGHGLTLFEEEVRVPLIVKFPRGEFGGERCDDVVRLIDLLPTVAEALGVDKPRRAEGMPLQSALRGDDVEPRVATGSSPNMALDRKHGSSEHMSYARRGAIKYIDPPAIDLDRLIWSHLDRPAEGEDRYDLESDPMGFRPRLESMFGPQLFDLSEDPVELDNLVDKRTRQRDGIVEYLKSEESRHAAILSILQDDKEYRGPVFSDEEMEHLVKNLIESGYATLEDAQEMMERNRQRREERERQEAERQKKRGARNRGAKVNKAAQEDN